MGVGTSLGATFDDSFHQAQNQWNPDKFPSTGEIAPPASASNDDNVQSDLWTQLARTDKSNTPIPIADTDKAAGISIHPAPADTGEPSPAVPFSPSNIEDRRGPDDKGEGLFYPGWKGAFVQDLKNKIVGEPSIPEAPRSPLSDQLGREDAKIEPQIDSRSFLDKGVDDVSDAISLFKDQGSKLGTDTPFSEMPFSEGSKIVNKLFGAGGEERFQTWPERAVRGAIDTFSLPHKVMTGEVPAGSIQEIEKAADLAMTMVGGPAPVAAKMADGTLGSFAGVRARPQAIDKAALYKAQEMEMNGLPKDEIWNQTGFFRGAEDNRWKFEIPDKDMKLKPEAFDTTITPARGGNGGQWDVGGQEATTTVGLKDQKKDFFGQSKPVMLPDVIDHPALFKAYPELKLMKVEPTQPFNSNIGGYGVQSNTLFLKRDLDPEFAKSVIMHEVQHAIQEIEGFSKGGSPKQFKPPKLDELIEDFNKAKQVAEDDIYKKNPDMKPGELGAMKGAIASEIKAEESNGKLSSFLKPYVERAKSLGIYDRLKNIVKTDKIVLEKGQEYFDKYHQLHGEIEARNVQARMKFDWLDRQFNAPFRFKDWNR